MSAQRPLHLAIAQLNLVVGDLSGNVDRIRGALEEARQQCAEVLVTPELAITGYPPQDLLLKPRFLQDVEAALATLIPNVHGVDLVVGHPEPAPDGLHNSASWIRAGQVVGRYRKQRLPNYGVFDEQRYFHSGHDPCVVELNGVAIGVTICEDAWGPHGPMVEAAASGAQILLNLNASPYDYTKAEAREREISMRARETDTPCLYVNLVGGQDELVFDGTSFALDRHGEPTARFPAFSEGVYLTEFDRSQPDQVIPIRGEVPNSGPEEESVYRALMLGIRDYVDKNGFPGVLVGLSGGIDSAVTVALAVDALGPSRVEAVSMPSPYTSEISRVDSQALAHNLNIPLHTLPIEEIHTQVCTTLTRAFGEELEELTVENIQARARGLLLMALSNQTGFMVLTTGNKSEMSMGYATLYGDMVGGFSALKDVPKGLVYKLAELRNSRALVIPERIITRAPSAELAPNQKDSDTLPAYPILDGILHAYVEEDLDLEAIGARGYPIEVVREVINRVEANEYKRRQAPPGVRISPRALGTDRRYPITSKYRC